MKFRQRIVLLLALLLCLTFVPQAQAQTTITPAEYGYALIEVTSDGIEVTEYSTIMASTIIQSTSLSCEKLGNGQVRAGAAIVASFVIDELWITSLKIQEKQSSSWVTVKSTSNSKKTNASVHSASITYQGVAGREYRSVASYKAVNGSTADTRTDKTAGPIVAN